MNIFLEQLKSKDTEDVEANAEILAEIIKGFAVSFNLDLSKIIELISDKDGSLNMEQVRTMLYKMSIQE